MVRTGSMPSVLFVSKPVAPPWNDSNKNLVRAIAQGISRYNATILVPVGQPQSFANSEQLYQSVGSYAPALRSNAAVFKRLLLGKREDIWHFFFGPNRRTLQAGKLAKTLRRTRCVHTIASAPDHLEQTARWFFADKIVVLSRDTQRRLATVGCDATVIRPAIEPLTVSPERINAAKQRYQLTAPYVLYPGDLEFGNGARTFVEAAARTKQLQWVVAARAKTPSAATALVQLKKYAEQLGAKLTWLGEIEDIHAVVAGASVVSLVTDTLHAKMDWPLVLLEALMCKVPCVILKHGAMAELQDSGGCALVSPGNSEEIVAAAQSVLASQTPLRARQARQWVIDQCAPSRIAREYETLYDSLLHG